MQPSTSKAATERVNNNYQVLNISNVNARNDLVLNDEQLLSLIQNYPYLYNPHVRPNKDPDYDTFAWHNITKKFNRSYESLNRAVWFTIDELKQRWETLQPIVRSLSRPKNIKSLPESLRQTVIKISLPMEETTNVDPRRKALTSIQTMMLEYMPMVKKLPLVHRRRLEAEVMELILNMELESKATVKLGIVEHQAVEKDFYDVLNAAGLSEFHIENIVDDDDVVEVNNANDTTISTPTTVSEEETAKILNEPTPDLELEKVQQCNSESDSILPTDLVEVVVKIEIEKEYNKDCEVIKNSLHPLTQKNIVPLDRWRDYTRKCRVRVKRFNFEDEIPLARIKREKINF